MNKDLEFLTRVIDEKSARATPESRPALPEPFPTEQENLSWESSASMMPCLP